MYLSKLCSIIPFMRHDCLDSILVWFYSVETDLQTDFNSDIYRLRTLLIHYLLVMFSEVVLSQADKSGENPFKHMLVQKQPFGIPRVRIMCLAGCAGWQTSYKCWAPNNRKEIYCKQRLGPTVSLVKHMSAGVVCFLPCRWRSFTVALQLKIKSRRTWFPGLPGKTIQLHAAAPCD